MRPELGIQPPNHPSTVPFGTVAAPQGVTVFWMGLRGQRPKPPGQAVTCNPRLYDWTAVEAVPNRSGPRLPPRRHNGRPSPKSVKETWRVWSQMPHAALWQPSDWSFAMETRELLARATDDGGGSVALWSEIRLREKAMATTFDSRQSLRIRYVTPDKDGPAGPV